MKTGDRIKAERERRNISQKILAEKINLNVSVMNRIENGDRPLRDDELLKIANFLEVSTDYLLGNNAVEENPDEKDVGVTFEKLKKQLATSQGLMFNGEVLDEETAILILEELERQEKIVKVINKKYIPKKYRKE